MTLTGSHTTPVTVMCNFEVGGVCPSFPGFILSISISDQYPEKISIYLWSLGSHLHPAGAWSQADTREQLSHKLASVAHLLRLGFSKPFLEHLVLILELILPDDAEKASLWCPTGLVQAEDVTNPWPCGETKTWLRRCHPLSSPHLWLLSQHSPHFSQRD